MPHSQRHVENVPHSQRHVENVPHSQRGGKTHTLVTLYHLLKKPNEVGKLSAIKALLDAAAIKQVPSATVACLVGTALNAASDGTLWGEMARQLGGERLYRLVARNDETKPAPGSTLLGQLLQEAGPCLILLDEVLVYLLNAGSVLVGETTLKGTTLTFLQQLTIAVANCPHAVLIATLTSQLTEYMGEKAEHEYAVMENDRQLGSEYAKESVSEKCARSVFMYSFGGGQQRGATLPQIRLTVLNPEMAPPFIADALDRMTRRLWYLYQDSGLYRFESRPNLNRILVDREELIRSEPDKVREFARSTLNDLIGDASFRVFRYPQPGDDSAVADEPRLGLVVLDLNQGATEDGLPQETEALVTHILKQHKKGFRKHANMLVFLASDQQRSSEVIDAARRLLALRNIDDDKPTKKQLSEEQLRDLADRLTIDAPATAERLAGGAGLPGERRAAGTVRIRPGRRRAKEVRHDPLQRQGDQRRPLRSYRDGLAAASVPGDRPHAQARAGGRHHGDQRQRRWHDRPDRSDRRHDFGRGPRLDWRRGHGEDREGRAPPEQSPH